MGIKKGKEGVRKPAIDFLMEHLPEVIQACGESGGNLKETYIRLSRQIPDLPLSLSFPAFAQNFSVILAMHKAVTQETEDLEEILENIDEPEGRKDG